MESLQTSSFHIYTRKRILDDLTYRQSEEADMRVTHSNLSLRLHTVTNPRLLYVENKVHESFTHVTPLLHNEDLTKVINIKMAKHTNCGICGDEIDLLTLSKENIGQEESQNRLSITNYFPMLTLDMSQRHQFQVKG